MQDDPFMQKNPVSWKHVNFYGQYNFQETTGAIDFSAIVDGLESFKNEWEAANWHFAVLVKNTRSGSESKTVSPIWGIPFATFFFRGTCPPCFCFTRLYRLPNNNLNESGEPAHYMVREPAHHPKEELT